MTKQTVICVLGMHRSGTSCLAGTLEGAGVFFGEIITESPHNAKGNRENPKIMALHERLLAANGGTWDVPPARVVWADDHERERDEIIATYSAAPTWGFKDPRTVLTLDGWLRACPSMQLVGAVRHPLAVARSLAARDAMPFERAVDLWTLYNERLLGYWERLGVTIVSFDAPPDTFRSKLGLLLETLGLSGERSVTFFDPSLRHDSPTHGNKQLPPRARLLYEKLFKIAL